MAKGSALSRAIRFFEEGDIHEAAFALQRGAEIVKTRTQQPPAGAAAAKKSKAVRRSHKKAASGNKSNSAPAEMDARELAERQELSN